MHVSILTKIQNYFLQTNRRKAISSPNIKTIGDIRPYWINLGTREDYLKAYKEVPQLNAIINASAESFSKGRFKLWKVSASGEKEQVQQHKILDVLDNPNPTQSTDEFITQFYKNWQVFGNSFLYFASGLDKIDIESVSMLFTVPAQHMQVKPLNQISYFNATEIEELIDKYLFVVGGQNTTFEPQSILHINDASIDYVNDTWVWGESRIDAIRYALSNIRAAYEARNVILTKRGAIGILSNIDRDSAGKMPLTPEEREELQIQFQQYGLTADQAQIIITDASLSWQPMTLPIAELQLTEGIQSDKIAVCDAYNFPILLLNELEGSTFSNVKEAQKSLYTNKIIPEAKLFEKALNQKLKTKDFGYWLEYSFDHLEILQEDINQKAQTDSTQVQTLINLNSSVASGEMSRDTAINIAIYTLSIPEEQAELLITAEPAAVPGQAQLNGNKIAKVYEN